MAINYNSEPSSHYYNNVKITKLDDTIFGLGDPLMNYFPLMFDAVDFIYVSHGNTNIHTSKYF